MTIYQCLFHLCSQAYSNAQPSPNTLIFSENTTSQIQSILAAGKVINVDVGQTEDFIQFSDLKIHSTALSLMKEIRKVHGNVSH